MTSHATLASALRAVARGNQRVEWDAWYPLAQACAHDLNAFTHAIGALSDEDLYNLLDNLKTDGGPLADYLLLTLAAHPEAVRDDQVRAYLLLDSTTALERRQRLLANLVDQLRTVVDHLTERAQSGFDLAAEIATLERRRNILEAEQLESGYREMVELESEIARLELFRAQLAAYDARQRRAERGELQAETDRLRSQRNEVEEQNAVALRARDEARERLDELRSQSQALTQELADARALQETLTSQVNTLTQEVSQVRQRVAEVTGQAEALSDQRQQLEASLHAQESRLDQLRSSPVRATAERLQAEIRELYQQLPADDAEPMFSPQPQRSTR